MDREPVFSPRGPHGACEVAQPIGREYRGLLEGRDKERAGQVRPVMLHAVHIRANAGRVQIAGFGQLVKDPSETSHRPGTAQRETRQANCIERLSAQSRPGVAGQSDVIDLGDRHSGLLQAVSNRSGRKARGILDAIEALLLGRGHELTVADDCGRSVPMVSIDAEDVHVSTTSSS